MYVFIPRLFMFHNVQKFYWELTQNTPPLKNGNNKMVKCRLTQQITYSSRSVNHDSLKVRQKVCVVVRKLNTEH